MEGCVFSQRCVSVDDYLAEPLPNLDPLICPLTDQKIKKVPVLRIFGATQHGQKSCTHVHGVFPYLLIPADEIPNFKTDTGIVEVHKSLEAVLNRSYGSATGQFIHNIASVSGISFYGFHESERQFLKISFYQHRYVKRTAELLLQGCLGDKAVQPHEAHYNYSLQFLTDYNIHGMNLIHYRRVMFRTSEDNYEKLRLGTGRPDYITQTVDMAAVPQRHLLSPEKVVKKCSSELELDVLGSDILNVNFIDVNCNPGLKAICDEERQRRHKTGIFTPQNKPATPVRGMADLPRTREWEEKLQGIIRSHTELATPDQDVVDFLLDLNATQFQVLSSSPASSKSASLPGSQTNISSKAASLPGSQTHISSKSASLPGSQTNISSKSASLPGSQTNTSSPRSTRTPSQTRLLEKLQRQRLNLSIRGDPGEEEGESSEDEEQVSITMSQRVFYSDEGEKRIPATPPGKMDRSKRIPATPPGKMDRSKRISATPPEEMDRSKRISATPPEEKDLSKRISATPPEQMNRSRRIPLTPSEDQGQSKSKPLTPPEDQGSSSCVITPPAAGISSSSKESSDHIPSCSQETGLKAGDDDTDVIPSTPHPEITPKSGTDDEDLFDEMLDDNLIMQLQLDGMNDVCEDGGKRKKRRLGGRLEPSTRVTRNSDRLGKALFASTDCISTHGAGRSAAISTHGAGIPVGPPENSPEQSFRVTRSHPKKRPLSRSPISSSAVGMSTSPGRQATQKYSQPVSPLSQKSPKGVSTVKLSQDSTVSCSGMSLSQFEELQKFSPRPSVEKRYQKLDIVSPTSASPRRHVLSSRRQHLNKLELTPTKRRHDPHSSKVLFTPQAATAPRPTSPVATPVIQNQTSHFQSKRLFADKISPKSKIRTALRMFENDFRLTPTDNLNDALSNAESTSESELSTTQEKSGTIPTQEKAGTGDLNARVLNWMSESEASQDEGTAEESEPNVTADLKSENSKILEASASVHISQVDNCLSVEQKSAIFPANPKDYSVDKTSPLLPECNLSPAERSSESLFSSGDKNSSKDQSRKFSVSEQNQSEGKLSDRVKFQSSGEDLFASSISPTCGNKTIDCSPVIVSPLNLSGSSITSHPRIELDSTLFYSQFHVDPSPDPPKSTSLSEFTYKIPPPTLAECKEYLSEIGGDVSAVEPFCSVRGDVPPAQRIGSKRMVLKHVNDLPDKPFNPECSSDLGVVPLEILAEDLDLAPRVDRVVNLKYLVPPPTLKQAREWLKSKRSKSSSSETGESSGKAQSEPLPVTCTSTPISSTKSNINSLPDRFITPIARPRPSPLRRIRKQRDLKFTPSAHVSIISPTLHQNSQISANNDSFKFSPVVADSTKSHVVQHLTVMSVEMFAGSLGDKRPNPNHDGVIAVFYSLYNDSKEGFEDGVICVTPKIKPRETLPNLIFVDSEGEVYEEFFRVIHRYDPDILVGYQIKTSSLGYLIERGHAIGLNFESRISRFPEETKKQLDLVGGEVSSWWVTGTNEVQLAGRVILNLWRLMRTEVTLTSYTFESVAYHVLQERFPFLPTKTLLSLYSSPKTFLEFYEYLSARCRGNLRLLLDLNIIVRTSEMGRLFGIEFFNVLSRGSQYRVESMMSRLSKPLNYISISPSPEQRAGMAAPELIPLVMEPESTFYGDPVVVLDFQSLYPSMIIAYNMCFSTCLGRVNYLGSLSSFPFGTSTLHIPPDTLAKYRDHIFVSPNGVAFVTTAVRKGILPTMLSEILETRIMVKEMMKQFKEDKALYKMLDARQMALKLIANVTYGYTSANFSGRMPCIEIGDSIVAKGRETLEATIELINNTPKWGGRVVYGDTDSVFVLFKGVSKAEAFRRGHEIAGVVTSMNPKPVKLKFEKVYQPCVLQTKKRYVGIKFETPDDPGEFEAKGIETVRRDGCPASVKTLRHALTVLFNSRDVSRVKSFVQSQFLKISRGSLSLQEFIFAKEYRGKDRYRPGACVPALEIARRRLKQDVRSEPLVGERVQYVICYGSPGLPLIQLIHEPTELLSSDHLQLNAVYYITKSLIPPLQRVFGLLGVSVIDWWNELPRDVRVARPATVGRHTIAHYYQSRHCPFCDRVSEGLCACYSDPQKVAVLAESGLGYLTSQLQSVYRICVDCVGTEGAMHACANTSCPVLYKRVRLEARVREKDTVKGDTFKLFNW